MDPSVKQRILVPNPKNIPGDCLNTCLSQLLDMDYDFIPHFALFKSNWKSALELWAPVALPDRILNVWGSLTAFKKLEHLVPKSIDQMIAVDNNYHSAIIDRNLAPLYDPHPPEVSLTTISYLIYFRGRE